MSAAGAVEATGAMPQAAGSDPSGVDAAGRDSGLMVLPNPSVSPDAEEYPINFRPGVMSDTQLNTLRGQISEYSKICQTLVQLHHQRQAQLQAENGLGGQRDGNTSGGKTARQRWTPTPSQLQVLENIFAKGNGTPSKQKIKDITKDLSVHGPIQDTNVYNWFQNRKARAKRKQMNQQPQQQGVEHQIKTDQPPYSGGAHYGGQPQQQVEAAKSQWVPIQVTINDRPWEVMGGMLDVKNTFGEGVMLFDVHNSMVPLSADGVVLTPVQAGCIYRAYNPAGGAGGAGPAGSIDTGAPKRSKQEGGFSGGESAPAQLGLPPQ